MICISIAQDSRRLALADMVNAAPQCDLIECRLDRFAKAPEVGELMTAKSRPIIMSCRRADDGGEWKGSEEDRLAILRQCIISKADYVEIELDAADHVRKFPPSQRVIAYTNLHEVPRDLDDIYADMQTKTPDVIKLVALARTPEEAWPLVKILVRPPVPTVVVGLGRCSLMLTLLGKKIGAPWAYAALERGMEAYPGQPTVGDLQSVYHYHDIGRNTPFLGVTGSGELPRITMAALNAVFREAKMPHRCLPMVIGDIAIFRQIMKAVHLTGLVVDAAHQAAVMEIAQEHDAESTEALGADLLLRHDKTWTAHNLFARAAVAVLETTVRAEHDVERPLEGRHVMIAGVTPIARSMAAAIARRGGLVAIASRNRDRALAIAKAVDARFIQFEAIYTTMHHVLVIAGDERQVLPGRPPSDEPMIHHAHFQHQLTVMDVTELPTRSALLQTALERGCHIVSPRRITLAYLQLLARMTAGKDARVDVIKDVVREFTAEEDEAQS
jgi:3-dehydroquinate dehydratase/shikimate dehydrogenase